LQFFLVDPAPFYKFAKNLIPAHKLPLTGAVEGGEAAELVPAVSATHKFICALDDHKKLLRNYSQNIDGLELASGLNPKKLVQCHGSMEKFTCTECHKRKKIDKCVQSILEGSVVHCSCKNGGVYKPDITFFGEVLPAAFFKTMEKDVRSFYIRTITVLFSDWRFFVSY